MNAQIKHALCAERLRVLADDTRFAVIEALMARSRTTGELAEELGVEQSLLSHHLKVLRDAELVSAERTGRHARYSLSPGVHAADGERSVDLGCCKLQFESEDAK